MNTLIWMPMGRVWMQPVIRSPLEFPKRVACWNVCKVHSRLHMGPLKESYRVHFEFTLTRLLTYRTVPDPAFRPPGLQVLLVTWDMK
jgi:hypothetical protein